MINMKDYITYINEGVNELESELGYTLQNNYELDVSFEKTPNDLIVEFPDVITTKERWFFQTLSLAKMHGFAPDIVGNKILFKKIRR